MRFAIVGAGAVGGYFGGRLVEAGHDVTFIARGETLQALRRDGLRVRSVDGDFRVTVQATDRPQDVGTVDCVLFGVKAWQIEVAARQALPLFAADSFAVPLLNGIEVPDRLAGVLGTERVLGGLCRIIARVESPGLIRHFGARPTLELGELDGVQTARLEDFLTAVESAEFVAKVPKGGIRRAMWGKFLFIVATGAVGAVTRRTLGEIRRRPETRRLLQQSMAEIHTLSRRHGVDLSDDAVERSMAFLDGLPEETTASMQRDIMEGRPSELDAQCGAVLRLARQVDLAVPVNELLHAALVLQEADHRRPLEEV